MSLDDISKLDLVVIGAGQAGCAAAMVAARGGLSTAVVEMDLRHIGGAFVHETGLPPSVFANTAVLVDRFRRGAEFAVDVPSGEICVQAAGLLRRKYSVVGSATTSLRNQLNASGVRLIEGRGFLADEHTVAVLDPETGDEKAVLQARAVLIATGSCWQEMRVRPDGKSIVWLEGLLAQRRLPRRLLIVGSSLLACETAATYAMLGCTVALVCEEPVLMQTEDPEVVEHVAARLSALGAEVITQASLLSATPNGETSEAVFESMDEQSRVGFDVLTLVPDRVPNLEMLGARKLGLCVDGKDLLSLDSHGRTSLDHIAAAGSCAGRSRSSMESRLQGVVAGEALLGRSGVVHVEVPRTGSAPVEFGAIGLSDDEIAELECETEVSRTLLQSTPKAVVTGDCYGVLKVLSDKDTGEILRASACGPGACQLISILATTRALELGLPDVASFASGMDLGDILLAGSGILSESAP